MRDVTEEYINDDDKIDEVEPDLEQTKMSGEMLDDSQHDINEVLDTEEM